MRNKITISLVLIGAALLVSIALTELLSKGGKGDQVPFVPIASVAQFTQPPLVPVSGVLPSQTPTVDLSQSRNCTYTYYFWRDHPEGWPDRMEIAGKSIMKDQAIRLMQAPSRNPIEELQRVVYITQLNIHSGADSSPINKTIQDASDWLAANPPGIQMSEFKQSTTALFVQTLEDYNNGFVGPGLCPDQPQTPTPTSTALIHIQETTELLLTPTATPRSSQPSITPTSQAIPPRLPSSPTDNPAVTSSFTPTPTPSRTLTSTGIPSSTPFFSTVTSSPTSKAPTSIPSATQKLPTITPSRTPIPPSSTALPPSNTPIPPSSTPTPEPPTNTPTPLPPTGTPIPEPPTNTPTPIPPTSTPTLEPTNTKTPKPKPTHPLLSPAGRVFLYRR